MSVGRRIVGIFGILLAVFAGGCGLLFLIGGLSELSAGRNDYGVSIISPVMGGVPALIGGLIAWWAFRKPPEDASTETGPASPEEGGEASANEDKPL
jgi:hypothetical protein